MSRRDQLLRLLACVVLGVVLGVPLIISFTVTPAQIESGAVVLSPPCTFKRIVGRDCPSCGLTRAFAAIGHGDLPAARAYHRGAVVVYGLYVIGVAFALVGGARALLAARRSPRMPSP